MAQTYSLEAIQEFRKKDLQTRKAGILITFYSAHKRLPTNVEEQDWVDRIYHLSEKDKQIINPDYIPNTKEGEPFESEPPKWDKDKESKKPREEGKVNKEDLE